MDYANLKNTVIDILSNSDSNSYSSTENDIFKSHAGLLFIAFNSFDEESDEGITYELKIASILINQAEIICHDEDYLNKPYDIRVLRGGIGIYYVGEKQDVANFLINDAITLNTFFNLLNSILRRRDQDQINFKISLTMDETEIIHINSLDKDIFSGMFEDRNETLSKYQCMNNLSTIMIDENIYDIVKKGCLNSSFIKDNLTKQLLGDENEEDNLKDVGYGFDIVLDNLDDYIKGKPTNIDNIYKNMEDFFIGVLNNESKLSTIDDYHDQDDLFPGLKCNIGMINIELAYLDEMHPIYQKSRVLKAFYEAFGIALNESDAKFINAIPFSRSFIITFIQFDEQDILQFFDIALTMNAVCSLVNKTLDEQSKNVVLYSITYNIEDSAISAVSSATSDYMIPFIPEFLWTKTHYFGLKTIYDENVKPIVVDAAIAEFIINEEPLFKDVFAKHIDDITNETYYSAYFFPEDFEIEEFAY